ncbi:MAG: hypothetical protein ACK4YF_08170 [Exilispira sp.]
MLKVLLSKLKTLKIPIDYNFKIIKENYKIKFDRKVKTFKIEQETNMYLELIYFISEILSFEELKQILSYENKSIQTQNFKNLTIKFFETKMLELLRKYHWLLKKSLFVLFYEFIINN